MVNPWKIVTDELFQKLSDESTGFNAFYQEAAAEYGTLTVVEVDWSPGSKQFMQAYLSPDEVKDSQLTGYAKPVVALYTSVSENTNDEKFRIFSGNITAHVDIYYKSRQGAPVDDLEKVFNSIKAAVLNVFNQRDVIWSSSLAYNGEFSCNPDPIELYGDGYVGRVPFEIVFEVNV